VKETTTNDNQNEENLENKAKELDTKEGAITELNQQVEDLKGQVKALTKEQEAFPTISNLTKDFVQAHITVIKKD
jgi:chromosome segregation ATPase